MQTPWVVTLLRALRPLILLALLVLGGHAGLLFFGYTTGNYPTTGIAVTGLASVVALGAAAWLITVLLRESRGG